MSLARSTLLVIFSRVLVLFAGLALIGNTAPVAYGALGTPIITLAKVTGLNELTLSAMVGRQLPVFSLLVPFWLIWAFCGFRGMLAIWPAILVAGASFAIPQYLISNFHGPWLVDVGAAVSSMVCLTLFLKVWKPKEIMTSASGKFEGGDAVGAAERPAIVNPYDRGPRYLAAARPRRADRALYPRARNRTPRRRPPLPPRPARRSLRASARRTAAPRDRVGFLSRHGGRPARGRGGSGRLA